MKELTDEELYEAHQKGLCSCGSGLYRQAQFDGHGIFLTYACEECEGEKLGKFRPDIHKRYECDEPIDED